MPDKKYDFAGWVTKSDILCADGLVIKHDAFKDNDGDKVPLVWEHQRQDPNNILGHVILHNKGNGVYGYGYFNETPTADNTKELLRHGDIQAMSIFANRLQKRGQDVTHGMIREVSLVLAGANPGALIQEVVEHSDVDDEAAVIYTDNLVHSAEDLDDETGEETKMDEENKERTVQDILDGMDEDERSVVEFLVGQALEAASDDSDEEDEATQTEETAQHSELEDNNVKHNVFNKTKEDDSQTLSHSELNEIVGSAISSNASSLKEAFVEHGINNIKILFPDAHVVDAAPRMIMDPNTNYTAMMAKISKSPFSRIKTRTADFTEKEARAKGYIKGNEKIEQVFSVAHRETTPQTIYKKQKLDRDDIIDITDFDVVAYVNNEMRIMLDMEIVRAAFIGDGRKVADPDKIKEEKIRPIVKDDDFYTIKKEVETPEELIEAIIKAKAEYRGSGNPTLYIDPATYANLKLIKATDGRYLFENETALKARLGVMDIQETSFLSEEGAPLAVLVNLSDYTLGATKGGQVTTFDDFDIDFNQYKYLIETRLCGALTVPKSAITFSLKAAPASKTTPQQ